MTKSEQSMLEIASGATNKLQERLTDSIAEFGSVMTGMGYPVAAPPLMVDRFRNACMAKAVWEWLRDFPQLKLFATDQRREAAKDAQVELDKIANRLCGAIEAPQGFSPVSSWNSQNRLIMRMEPSMPPAQQITITGYNFPAYANPSATSMSAQDTIPAPPVNLSVFQSWITAGQLVLYWFSPANARTFNVFRGIASGQESVTPIATLVSGNTYIDTTCVVGTTYFYVVSATNEISTGPASNENFNTPVNQLVPMNPFASQYLAYAL